MLILLLLVLSPAWGASEYQVKAAFLYNFMRFVDWPPDRMPPEDSPMTIGVVGKNPFGSVLDAVESKAIKGRPLVVRYLPSLEGVTEAQWPQHMSELKKCHLLFIARSEKPFLPKMLPELTEASVLTVSEFEGFLDMKGMINFMTEENKGRFEINLKVTREANLDIRAKLLRLAKQVKE